MKMQIQSLKDFTTQELRYELYLRRKCTEPMGMESCVACARRIVAAVAEGFGLMPEQILGRRREKRVVRARHVAMAAILQQGHSIAEVAAVFGCHHTSVWHASNKIIARSKACPRPQFAAGPTGLQSPDRH
jgi:chromosomal replication initiation ATPase DnaA